MKRRDGPDHVLVEVAAGESWDALVARAVVEGWSGIEALSGIPGLTGATPVQNVGAYGQEVAQTVVSVRVLDRGTGELVDLTAAECGFAYRSSMFKGDDRAVVLRVSLRLERSARSGPLAYAELARSVGAPLGDRVASADVRDGRPGAAPEQGDGPRPGRPGHARASGRSSPTPSSTPTRPGVSRTGRRATPSPTVV